MQDQWENRQYVVEKQPYPNVPVYVVCPRDGEGHSQTLHRKYLLPISPNLEQSKMDKPVAGVENDTSLTPVPPVSDAPVRAEPSGTVTLNSAGSTPEDSPDWPAPLQCSTQTTRNQLPVRYRDMVKYMTLDQLASGIHGLAYVSVYTWCFVCVQLSGSTVQHALYL